MSLGGQAQSSAIGDWCVLKDLVEHIWLVDVSLTRQQDLDNLDVATITPASRNHQRMHSAAFQNWECHLLLDGPNVDDVSYQSKLGGFKADLERKRNRISARCQDEEIGMR